MICLEAYRFYLKMCLKKHSTFYKHFKKSLVAIKQIFMGIKKHGTHNIVLLSPHLAREGNLRKVKSMSRCVA